jgi:hypothetical protein
MNDTGPQQASLRRRRLLCQGLALGLMGRGGAAWAGWGDTQLQWHLSEGQVLDAGRLHELAEGVLHEGFELSARALARHAGGLLPDARLVLGGQAFSPASASGGQQPGRWYLRGLWWLQSGEAQAAGATAGRHPPGALHGQFSAELASNPWADPAAWQAELRMPFGRYAPIDDPGAVQAMRAHGALNLNAALDGELSLNLQAPWRGEKR